MSWSSRMKERSGTCSGFTWSGPGHFWSHLLESRRRLNVLLSEMDDLGRYLNESERAALHSQKGAFWETRPSRSNRKRQ